MFCENRTVLSPSYFGRAGETVRALIGTAGVARLKVHFYLIFVPLLELKIIIKANLILIES